MPSQLASLGRTKRPSPSSVLSNLCLPSSLDCGHRFQYSQGFFFQRSILHPFRHLPFSLCSHSLWSHDHRFFFVCCLPICFTFGTVSFSVHAFPSSPSLCISVSLPLQTLHLPNGPQSFQRSACLSINNNNASAFVFFIFRTRELVFCPLPPFVTQPNTTRGSLSLRPPSTRPKGKKRTQKNGVMFAMCKHKKEQKTLRPLLFLPLSLVSGYIFFFYHVKRW